MKKPMTTEELFIKIRDILKEKDKLPDILDYGLAAAGPVPIRTYQFDLGSSLAYGCNEGIYLGLWIEYFRNGERHTDGLGTFKTLHKDHEAMHKMAGLLADFLIEEYSYLNANLDDFTWEGADVRPFDENEKMLCIGYTCPDMESALKRKDELLQKYPCVSVRDNRTRKEKIFRRENNRTGKKKKRP